MTTGGNGVATDLAKVQDILNWPLHDTITKLRGFVGLTGYYRRFIIGYENMCRPLFDLLKKNTFDWKEEHTQVFEQLKRTMTSCPVLVLPNFNQHFILEIDASGTCIGGVLMQGGQPVAYFSKTLGPQETSKSIYEKEAMAIWECLKNGGITYWAVLSSLGQIKRV